FRAGNAAAATELLRQAVAIQPDSPSLHTNLGIALAAQRQFEEAIAKLRHALALEPNSAHILMNLAAALKDAGKLDDAIGTYRHIISLQPARSNSRDGEAPAEPRLAGRLALPNPVTSALAYYKLGCCLRDVGNLDAAIDAYRWATQLQPDSVPAHNDLANCLYLKGRFHEAIAEYERTIALRPDYFHSHNNLSISLHEVGRLDEAVAAVRRAIELNPNFPEAYYNLGRVLLAQRKFDQSAAACEQALKLRPGYVEARNNLAIALEASGSLDRAIAEYRTVLAARPDYLDAKMNYGVALKNSGRVDEAIATYREILQASPGFEETRWNLGIALLLKGDFTNGWREYESRRKIKRIVAVRDFPQPLWAGEPLGGRRILLHAEQGLGDAIQFIRYMPRVRQAGGHVVVLCYQPLRRLFANQLGIDQLITDGQPLPAFDVHCPLLSLPGIMQTTLDTIPADVPYLTCDPDLAESWRSRLSAHQAGLRVGLVWAGNPAHARDHDRSLPLTAFAPLAGVKNVRFFSLQKGDRGVEARTPPPGMDLIDFTGELNDFADTAALISNLDLIVAADTAVAHLAGALGKPVWLLRPFAPDWRWMLDRADCPWYPTMRLFRQRRWGDWSEPIEQIAAALTAERQKHSR
ncbi:MAG TPA: tetratricopeptide repeat protein, partial [Tepidisphaeraceae bacterium]|nr:tetratricopeptide repeat protein [Tepidisphaeraceae bacterium]